MNAMERREPADLNDPALRARAVAAARAAQLVIMVLGGSSVRHFADAFADNGAVELSGGPVTATSGEGVDVAEVALPDAQRELVESVAATGRPIVAVIISGRPLGLGPVLDHCRAVLWAGYFYAPRPKVTP